MERMKMIEFIMNKIVEGGGINERWMLFNGFKGYKNMSDDEIREIYEGNKEELIKRLKERDRIISELWGNKEEVFDYGYEDMDGERLLEIYEENVVGK